VPRRSVRSQSVSWPAYSARWRCASKRHHLVGDDPKTSALDRNCKAHELDNLYVVDGSFFCSSGAVNPALTIIANALRVGDHLLERMGAGRSDEKMMAAIS
jgi:choline dehydrogenase-like flavoprotein